MQSDDSIWRGHRKRQPGKDLTISLAKFGIQSFPEIGRVKGAYSIAFVISHEQIERTGVSYLLPKEKIDVLQGSWSPVDIVPEKNQFVSRLEIPADDFVRGFKITVSIANESDFAGCRLYQLCFRGEPVLCLVEQLLYFFPGHTTKRIVSKKYTLSPVQKSFVTESKIHLKSLPTLFSLECF